MIMDYPSDIITLSACIELAKVIDERSHAGRKIQHTVHKLPKGNCSCIIIIIQKNQKIEN